MTARVGKERVLLLQNDPIKAAGIEFIDENGGGPGVRLSKRPATAGSLIFTGYCPKTPSGARARRRSADGRAAVAALVRAQSPSAHAGKWSTVE
jgi:hypothetical protein